MLTHANDNQPCRVLVVKATQQRDEQRMAELLQVSSTKAQQGSTHRGASRFTRQVLSCGAGQIRMLATRLLAANFFRPHHAHRSSIEGDFDAVAEIDKSRNDTEGVHYLGLHLEMALINQTCVCRTPAPPTVLMRSL